MFLRRSPNRWYRILIVIFHLKVKLEIFKYCNLNPHTNFRRKLGRSIACVLSFHQWNIQVPLLYKTLRYFNPTKWRFVARGGPARFSLCYLRSQWLKTANLYSYVTVMILGRLLIKLEAGTYLGLQFTGLTNIMDFYKNIGANVKHDT